jgi:hypothetical protein
MTMMVHYDCTLADGKNDFLSGFRIGDYRYSSIFQQVPLSILHARTCC